MNNIDYRFWSFSNLALFENFELTTVLKLQAFPV